MLVTRQVGAEGEEELMESLNTDGWGNQTVRTPGSFAGPREMNAVIRELFCHDSILEYQRRVVEAASREVAATWRRVIAKKAEAPEFSGPAGKAVLTAMSAVVDSIDPEHSEWDGFFPPVMLCTEHDTAITPKFGKGVVFSACPGVPWCRAHDPARVER